MALSIPQGFSLFGVDIKFYGLISASAYMIGVIMTCFLAKKRGFKTDDILTLAVYVIPLAIIGARLYYVLFKLEYYTNFWDIFKIWEGGLAFYGGLIGGSIGVLLYCLIHKKNFLALADIIVPSLALCQAIGRWGNFFNQEAFGYLVTDKNLQWFPFSVYIENLDEWHLATFFYESLWDFLTFVGLYLLLYKGKFKQNGIIAYCYLVFYGIGRMFIEGLRTDSLYIGSIRVSQLLSLVFIIIGIALIIGTFVFSYVKKKKENKSFAVIMKVLKTDL